MNEEGLITKFTSNGLLIQYEFALIGLRMVCTKSHGLQSCWCNNIVQELDENVHTYHVIISFDHPK